LQRLETTVAAPLDERRIKDRAHVLVRDGKFAAAIELYLKLIAVNRTDPQLRLRHAELCVRLHRTDAAVASYRVAAHLLANSGHAAKAHAALNCAVRLAPNDMAVRRALRELNQSQRELYEAQLPPPPVPMQTRDERPRHGTVEIASVVVGVGDDQDDDPTELFIPMWKEQPA
jgi:tetratricopeptide (TPR) repeat protein